MVGPTGLTSSYPFPGLCPVSRISPLGSPQTSCSVVSDFPSPCAGAGGGGGGYSLSALSPSVLVTGEAIHCLLSLPLCWGLGGLLTVCSLSGSLCSTSFIFFSNSGVKNPQLGVVFDTFEFSGTLVPQPNTPRAKKVYHSQRQPRIPTSVSMGTFDRSP